MKDMGCSLMLWKTLLPWSRINFMHKSKKISLEWLMLFVNLHPYSGSPAMWRCGFLWVHTPLLHHRSSLHSDWGPHRKGHRCVPCPPDTHGRCPPAPPWADTYSWWWLLGEGWLKNKKEDWLSFYHHHLYSQWLEKLDVIMDPAHLPVFF